MQTLKQAIEQAEQMGVYDCGLDGCPSSNWDRTCRARLSVLDRLPHHHARSYSVDELINELYYVDGAGYYRAHHGGVGVYLMELTAFGIPLRYNTETRSYTAQHPLEIAVTERLSGHGRQRWLAQLWGIDVRAHGYGETAAKAVVELEQEVLRREKVKAAIAAWAVEQ